VLSAIVGAAGLVPTLAAIEAGKDIALANKETLVTAGALVVEKAHSKGVRIIPVDSEHSAVFQCIEGNSEKSVGRVILTASGGPFLRAGRTELETVRISDALNHPNWKMGRKITIDSATMMNKGLEVVEARWEFDMEPRRIEVVIHPQSVVHSMVRYQDGSIIAQLGIADMRIPIAYALAFPHRLKGDWKPLEVTRQNELNFLPVDKRRYPALKLAYEALGEGGTMPAVLNAANEVAVAAFLERRIGFRQIHRIIAATMQRHRSRQAREVGEILEVDRWAREKAWALINGNQRR
jgi:1-deoxy-D-xylulose-5-phosphate reductoisomerase